MKNFVFTIFTMLLTVLLANGQNNYKCNCKLVYENKMSPIRITYFNDSLVMRELGDDVKDSTIKLFLDPSRKLEELYFKVNYSWREADTFLILNNVIGSRIGSFFYPYFPPDSMKKGEKFVRYLQYGNIILANVFNKIGDTILHGKSIAYYKVGVSKLENKTSIIEVLKHNLNSFPFEYYNLNTINDSISYFSAEAYSETPDPNDLECKFCLYTRFRKGETPYKKEKEYDVIFLEGDCENFLKNKPTFLKEVN